MMLGRSSLSLNKKGKISIYRVPHLFLLIYQRSISFISNLSRLYIEYLIIYLRFIKEIYWVFMRIWSYLETKVREQKIRRSHVSVNHSTTNFGVSFSVVLTTSCATSLSSITASFWLGDGAVILSAFSAELLKVAGGGALMKQKETQNQLLAKCKKRQKVKTEGGRRVSRNGRRKKGFKKKTHKMITPMINHKTTEWRYYYHKTKITTPVPTKSKVDNGFFWDRWRHVRACCVKFRVCPITDNDKELKK